MRVVLSAAARRDVLRVQLYYGDSAYTKEWFARKFSEAVRHLERMPESAAARPDQTRRDVRFWLMESYWFIQQARKESLLILAIAHTSRDSRTVLKGVNI